MKFSPALAFALGALPILAACTPQQGSISEDSTVDLQVLNTQLAFTKSKIQRGMVAIEKNNAGTPQQMRIREDTGSSATRSPGRPVPLMESSGQWYGMASVGYPLHAYKFVFDTASADVFLPGPVCQSQGCQNHTIYDPGNSTTAQDAMRYFSLAFYDGSYALGNLWYDTVNVNGVPALRQMLGDAFYYSDTLSSANFPADGYLGMGFRNLSNFDADPVFYTMLFQDAIAEPTFAFKFAAPNPELFIGGVNDNLYKPPFAFVPVIEEGFWWVEMDSVNVHGETILTSVPTIIDTSTPFIVGDQDNVAAFYSNIPGAELIGDGQYVVPCENLPTMSLTFGGVAFSISSSTFIIGPMADRPGCLASLIGMHTDPRVPWVVGTAFLQNVYTVFDLGQTRVGFAILQ